MNENLKINEPIFQYALELDYGELHFKLDKDTGLFAIVAIHSTKRGPALGGCRCREYDNIHDAVTDALRLAQGMTYKAAITGLPLGGGKSVLYKPKKIHNREAYFEIFGKFINDLNGRYITAMDSGTNPEDMDAISKHTRFVTSTSEGGDPSPHTAYGVFLALKAAVFHKLHKNSLKDLTIAIQGVGHVGFALAKHLHNAGAKLIVADMNPAALEQCQQSFGAKVVPLESIFSVECDVFAPCALGAILNDDTINQLKTHIVVGSANNQLALPHHGDLLHEKGILYGPDYVVNAGGLVHACAQFYKSNKEKVQKQIEGIYETALAIFKRSELENVATHIIADKLAEERLNDETGVCNIEG